MTFDDARRYLIANFEDMYLEAVIGVLSSVREEYAPTVEMTKEDKQSLLDLKSRATFYFFNQSVKKWQQDRIGLQMPYGCLTEDELMQAWLHPETIKIVDE